MSSAAAAQRIKKISSNIKPDAAAKAIRPISTFTSGFFHKKRTDTVREFIGCNQSLRNNENYTLTLSSQIFFSKLFCCITVYWL